MITVTRNGVTATCKSRYEWVSQDRYLSSFIAGRIRVHDLNTPWDFDREPEKNLFELVKTLFPDAEVTRDVQIQKNPIQDDIADSFNEENRIY